MRRSIGWVVGLVSAAQVFGGTTAMASETATASPGAPGAGDSYFPHDGNGGFWVKHYDLDLRYWPGPARLDGTATITALTDQALSRFNLDFLLRAQSVTVNGRPANFHKAGPHELVIVPATSVAAHRVMRVVVTYRDFPRRIKDPDGYSWWRTAKDSVFVNGEPHSAAVWFPLSDHPSDKATYDVRVAVPRRWKAISAGELVGHRIADTYSVWHWRQSQPMASYLSFLGLGTYTLARGTSGGLSYTYAWSSFFRRPVQEKIHRALARTPQYVAWLSTHLGPYPFTHIGGTAPGGFAVATIESQSAPVYGHYLFQRASLIKTTMVHELAHQWFGDSVSIRRWRDLWLNEGFAKYLEWWYAAAHGGPSLDQQMLDSYRAIPPRSRWWTIPPGDPGPGGGLFKTVYGRGAMTLQALRNVIGDRDFGRVVRTWTRTHEYGHGTTAQLLDLAERVSGHDLDRLFRVWLYRPERPARTVANGFPPRIG